MSACTVAPGLVRGRLETCRTAVFAWLRAQTSLRQAADIHRAVNAAADTDYDYQSYEIRDALAWLSRHGCVDAITPACGPTAYRISPCKN